MNESVCSILSISSLLSVYEIDIFAIAHVENVFLFVCLEVCHVSKCEMLDKH